VLEKKSGEIIVSFHINNDTCGAAGIPGVANQQARKETAMAKCEVCGKAIQIGNNVSHSNKKTKKIWHANVKRIKVLEDNRAVRKYVCTRCIRSGKVLKAV